MNRASSLDLQMSQQCITIIVQLTILMLKLNSQYAKTFARKDSAVQQLPEKNSQRRENRVFPLSQTNYQKQSSINRFSEFQRNLHGSRRTNLINAKPKLCEMRPFGEENGNYHYVQPQQSNLNFYSQSPRLNQVEKPSIKDLRNREDREQANIRRNYDKYGIITSHSEREPFDDKNNFLAKHCKRNEDIKNKVTQPQPFVGRNNLYQNGYYSKQFSKERDFKQLNRQINRREIDSQNYSYNRRKNHENQNQRNVRKLFFDQQCQKDFMEIQKHSQKNLKSQRGLPQVQKYEYMNNGLTERYPDKSVQMHRRKNIQQTPNRYTNSSAYQSGSAEKTRSLKQKSQILHQKLKKLTNNQSNCGKNEETTRFQPKEIMSSKFTARYRDINYSSNASKINLQMRQPHVSNTIQQVFKPSQTALKTESLKQAKNPGLSRTPSPIQQIKSSENQEQAIEKIMQLNEKINERIQSIIANYSKK